MESDGDVHDRSAKIKRYIELIFSSLASLSVRTITEEVIGEEVYSRTKNFAKHSLKQKEN